MRSTTPRNSCEPHRGKLNVNVNGLMGVLMESEGEETEQQNTFSSSFGMVDWGHFYDPQVADSVSQTIIDREQ